MAAPDKTKLARQISGVMTVGLGRPLRRNAKTDLLLLVAMGLSADSSLPPLRLYEDALIVSINRLGHGELGELAQIEFGVSPETRRVRYHNARQEIASARLGVGEEALARLERETLAALAEDLLARLHAMSPASSIETGAPDPKFSEEQPDDLQLRPADKSQKALPEDDDLS